MKKLVQSHTTMLQTNQTNISELVSRAKQFVVPQEQKDEPVTEVKKKKSCVVLTSSVGKLADTGKIAEVLNCDVEIMSAYYIYENRDAQEPEKNLSQELQRSVTSDVDIVVIQTGSNEISDFDLNEPITNLQQSASEQSKRLLELASKTASEFNCEVFVSERPPRYDS